MKCALGFDGGGTKTECVVLNEAGAIVARGKGPASNPTRIGFPAAFAALKETTRTATNSTRLSLEVAALCAGLAGTSRPENHHQMLHFLKEQFSEAIVDLRPDFELPLYAMPPGAAMVLIVGTGSAAVGRDSAGVIKREGGFGPANSDEGSAFDIGLTAIAASRTAEPSSASDELARQILRHLGCTNWAEVDSKAATSADAVYPRVFPVVAAAADTGNALAQSLLNSAAAKLAGIARSLAESLNLSQQKFPLGKTGGTVGRSRFFDQAIDRELCKNLPLAIISLPSIEPAEVAAWIALQLLKDRERAVP
jgi:N-acetylglucosamine kinase-like BadF-type ATPase